jgi:hypothetical protein
VWVHSRQAAGLDPEARLAHIVLILKFAVVALILRLAAGENSSNPRGRTGHQSDSSASPCARWNNSDSWSQRFFHRQSRSKLFGVLWRRELYCAHRPIRPGVDSCHCAHSRHHHDFGAARVRFVHQSPQVQTTLLGMESSIDLSLLSPYMWIGQGATVNVALTVRVLTSGVPIKGRTVNYYLDKGSATLNPPSTKPNSNGYATSSLKLSSLPGDMQVSVCVEPDAPCQTFLWNRGASFVAAAAGPRWRPPTHYCGAGLSTGHGSGHGHVHTPGPRAWCQRAVPVVAWTHHQRCADCVGRDITITRDPMPIILGMSQASVTSDANGFCEPAAIHWRISGCIGDPRHGHGWTCESAILVAIALANDGLRRASKRETSGREGNLRRGSASGCRSTPDPSRPKMPLRTTSEKV